MWNCDKYNLDVISHGTLHVYKVCPRSNEKDIFAQHRRPGKESGGRGRWRGNPGIQFDLPQLSPRLCSSRYISKVRSSFFVLSRGENAEKSGAALGNQVLCKTWKIWF